MNCGYKGTTGGGVEHASDIAVDNAGYVYVTGEGRGHFMTIKYDFDGNEIWIREYDSPESYSARHMTLDNYGNIYITGIGRGGRYDYLTVKYDPDGNLKWANLYDGPASDDDMPAAIAVDKLGNVYVTGRSAIFSSGDYSGYDYVTIKYDTDGNELWIRRYNGPANSFDAAIDIALDEKGNIYVTGHSRFIGSGEHTDDDFATIKYDTDGNEIWVRRYNGPENNRDQAYALTVDDNGNVYVTGPSYNYPIWEGDTIIGYNQDFATIKYNKNGNQRWVARYSGNTVNIPYDISLDRWGNVYVTGASGCLMTGGEINSDYATVKYDKNGNQIWVATYNGPGSMDDVSKAIVVNTRGTVYVTGESFWPTPYWNYDYATIKYIQKLLCSINLEPNTLNLKAQGKWITCYIELPEGSSIDEIDILSVTLIKINEDLLEPPLYTVGQASIGDYDNDEILDLMVKFDRVEVSSILGERDNVEVTITGELIDGTPFEGKDNIRVKQ